MKKKILSLGVIAILITILVCLTGCENSNNKSGIDNEESKNVKQNEKTLNKDDISKITSEDYGKKFNYSVEVNGVKIDDWKVFLKDEDGVYIIMSDYLPVEALGNKENPESIVSKTGLNIAKKYSVMFNDSRNFPEQDMNSDIIRKYVKEHTTDNYSSYLKNAITPILNSDNWKDFVDEKQGASYAIGTPTVEMFIKSWNEGTKNDKNRAVISARITDSYELKIDSVNGDVKYKENDEHFDDSEYDVYGLESEHIKTTDGYNNKLYYPHQEKVDGSIQTYWLASLYGNTEYAYYTVRFDGGITGTSIGSIAYYDALRPVVFLKNI